MLLRGAVQARLLAPSSDPPRPAAPRCPQALQTLRDMLVSCWGAKQPDVAVRLLQGAAELHPAAVDAGRTVLLGALAALQGSYRRDCLRLLLLRAPQLPGLFQDVAQPQLLESLLPSAKAGAPQLAQALAQLLGALLPSAPPGGAEQVLPGLVDALLEHGSAVCRWGARGRAGRRRERALPAGVPARLPQPCSRGRALTPGAPLL
jgi:hypothetical protein